MSWRGVHRGFIVLTGVCLGSCGNLNFDPQPVAPPPAAEVTPLDIGGLKFWLRADRGINYNSTTLEVSSWKEYVSDGVFTPLGMGSGPAYDPMSSTLGGAPSVTFQQSGGAAQFLQMTNAEGSFWCGSNYTVMAVIRGSLTNYPDQLAEFLKVWPTGGATSYFSGFLKYNSIDLGYLPFFDYSPAGGGGGGGGGINKVRVKSNLPPLPAGPLLVSFHFAGGGHQVRFNGQSGVSVDASPGVSPSCAGAFDYYIGKGVLSGAGGSTMEIGEILAFDWDLDPGLELRLGCYAKKRYGITSFVGACD